MGESFSPISNFFSLVTSREIKDAPHSRFWCGDPKVCSRGSLKRLDLALPQIYTRVFHLWKSVSLDNAWNGDSRPFIFFILACFRAFRDAPHSRFWYRDPKLCLEGPQQGSQIPFSRPFFPVNPAIPPFFVWKSRSRLLFLKGRFCVNY